MLYCNFKDHTVQYVACVTDHLKGTATQRSITLFGTASYASQLKLHFKRPWHHYLDKIFIIIFFLYHYIDFLYAFPFEDC